MSVTSSRTVQVQFSGDITESIIQSALDNTVSLAKTDVVTLSVGNNNLAAPAITGLVVTGVTLIPPSGNVIVITLKGANGDMGISIHITDPTSIGLGTGFSSLVLSVGTQVNGLRVIWT